MGKTRMTVLDVRACVAGLRNQLLGARVANVYDLDPKTYLIKTAKGGEKVLLLLESGIRFHSTSFNRDKSNTPSGFTLKLRKHIRTKKVEEVRQLGVDRIVAFTFGAGDEAFHLVLELFAGGNIILLDHQCKIISLLRTHLDEQTGEKTAVHETYPMDGQRENRRITMPMLAEALGKPAPHDKALVKDILTKELDYGLALVEHALLGAGMDLKRKVIEFDASLASAEMQALLHALEEVDDLVSNLGAEGRAVPGFIIRKDNKDDSPYDDFAPVLLRQFKSKAVVEFDSLDKALDAYFTVAEGQRIEQQKQQQQKAAISKVERVRRAHEDSIQALQAEEALNYHKATLIEANLSDVDNAILVVNSLLSQGTDWAALKRMVKDEAKKGNPIASLIHALKLESNQITVLLTFGLDYLGEEEQTNPVTAIDIDLGCNAYTNAQSYYANKKKAAQKADKTMQSGDKALKGAERKAKDELKRVDTKASIQLIRKTHWFEKFVWFISSENFLVVAGRDAQQNELLVKRHMAKGDIYLHADIHGAATHVIKNHTKDPVPPLTIAQAGLSCVCRSAAWDAKMVTSAYWVYPEQVSKSAPTGEYLSTGSFMIRGKKNYLPPNPLVMGFGLLFRLDDSSVAAHLGERRVRGLADDDSAAAAAAAAVAPGDDDDDGEEDDGGAEVQEIDGEGDDAAAAAAGAGACGDESVAADSADGSKTGSADVGKQRRDGVTAAAAEGRRQAAGGGTGGHGEGDEGGDVSTPVSARSSSSVATASKGDARRDRKGGDGGRRMKVGAPVEPEHNVDAGTKGSDGIRVGSAVTMAAFMPDDDDDAAAAAGDSPKPGADGGGKRHISAAERKLLRKGGGGGGGGSSQALVEQGSDGAAEADVSRPGQGHAGGDAGSAAPAVAGDGGANAKDRPKSARPKSAAGAIAGSATDGAGKKPQEKKAAAAGGGGGKGAAAAAAAEKAAATAAAATQAKRGQKGKKKRMEKYAEQDEEERELALAMLGHRPLPGSGGKAAAAAAGSADSNSDGGEDGGGGREDGDAVTAAAAAAGLAAEVEAALRRVVAEGRCGIKELDKTTLGKLAEFPAADGVEILQRFAEADILAQVKNKAAFLSGICHRYRDRKAKADREEVRKIKEEEGIVELDDEDKEKLVDLDSLTAQPRPGDVLHYCLPVCAPYFAMHNYKYRLKLTPGQGKKGKVAAQARALFLRVADGTARERDLIKAAPDTDLVSQILGNVRIVAPAAGKGK